MKMQMIYLACSLLLCSSMTIKAQFARMTGTRLIINTEGISEPVTISLTRCWPGRGRTDTLMISANTRGFSLADSLPVVYQLFSRNPLASADLILDGRTSKVTLTKDGFVFSGGVYDAAFISFLKMKKESDQQGRLLGRAYTNEVDLNKKIVIGQQSEDLQLKSNELMQSFILKNADNIKGAWLASKQANVLSRPIIAKLMQAFEGKDWARSTYDQLASVIAREKVSLTGTKASMFALPDEKAREVKLSDLLKENRWVLLDFWASWCVPCRAANRKLAPLYAAFKKRGIEVVSISVDAKESDWVKAIESDKLPWIQLRALEAMKSSVVKNYKVEGLPSTFLIDKDGIIIKTQLKEDDLLKL